MSERFKFIMLESDISFAVFWMGVGLILWGVIAVVWAPGDFLTFAGDMSKVVPALVWFFNYVGCGVLFVCIALKDFPPAPSLLASLWSVLAWTYIAGIRGFSNFTSGVSLNILVIVIGLMIAQRSRVK